MQPLLDVCDLSLSFRTENGRSRVLDMVNLSVRPGEIVGLVGESGCGKTTLARAILGTLPQGLTDIGSGHIRLDGVDMLRDRAAAERMRGSVVTFVPQDPFASFNLLFRVGSQIRDLMRFKAPRADRSRFGCRSRWRRSDSSSETTTGSPR